MPFAEFSPGNAGLALPQQSFQNGLAAMQAAGTMAEHRVSLMERAQRMAQDKEKFEMEKQRFADLRVLDVMNIAKSTIELTRLNNSLQLDDEKLQAEKAATEAQLRQSRNQIAEDKAAEQLLADMPQALASWKDIKEDDYQGLMKAQARFNQSYGALSLNPKYAARVAQVAGHHIDTLNARINSALNLSENSALEIRTRLEDTLLMPEATPQDQQQKTKLLSELLRSPDARRARLSPGEQGKALNAAVQGAMKTMMERQAELAKINATGDQNRQTAAAKAETDKKEAPQYLVEKSMKIDQTEKDLADLEQMANKQVTGPIVGFLRGLNPYDTDAKTFEAKLRAAVPNLARGIFSEVGVLTDTDIKNYMLTLPNVKTPEDQVKALVQMLRGTLERQRETLGGVVQGQGYKTGGLTLKGGKESGMTDGQELTLPYNGSNITGTVITMNGKKALRTADGKVYPINQ